ncbi:MAG: hypothetical protein KTQ49_03410 [Candidatus Omnitrophica bacterium]|nr:hypothetical protein [Candidatus Omnitrophota bacterium]
MDIHEPWEKALKHTEIVRPRVQPLQTFETTEIPYIFLAESLADAGSTMVRKGSVAVDKPSIVLPPHLPQFEGFDFEKQFSGATDYLTTFLLVRGIRFPSLKYENKIASSEVLKEKLARAADAFLQTLQREENVSTGLVIGPEDCWPFSILIFVCGQIVRSADGDIRRIFDRHRDASE